MAEDCVEIECGENKAKLFIAKLKGGNDNPCVWFEDKWLTPIEFQDVSGRRASRDWKRSIKCGGKPLKELLLGGEVNLFSLESHESSLQASDFNGEEAAAESDLIVADIPEGQKPLICVEYPAFVDNDDRAIASLGGLENISNAILHHKHSLEVRFRPEDSYCKPAIAKETKVANLVLRVKRRKKKGQRGPQSQAEPQTTYNFPPRSSLTEAVDSPSSPVLSGLKMAMDCSSPPVAADKEPETGKVYSEGKPKYEYSAEVLGLVDASYEFPGMADFQVLPPGLNMARHGSLLMDPELFQITEPLGDSIVDLNVPSFLPPQTFSKFDKPMTNYAFRSVDPKVKVESKATSVTDCGRPRRTNAVHSVPFNSTEPIPTTPHPDSPATSHPKLKVLNQLFEERPVWSRLALQSLLKQPHGIVRSLLSATSYNMISGPWKKLWVKFGYDPRKDPSAKIYQCLDFRVPKDVDVESERSRRLALQAPPRVGVKVVNSRVFQLVGEQEDSVRQAEMRTSLREEGDPTAVIAADETAYIFMPDKLPSQRQLFYQLCDLKDDSLQAIIHSNDGRETICTETNGWCEENSYEKLRKALAEMTRKTAHRVRTEQYQKLGTSSGTSLLKASAAEVECSDKPI